MRVELTTYSFEIDDRFQGRQTEFEGGSVWVAPMRPTEQPTIFNFALSETKDIVEEFAGEAGGKHDYAACVRAYFGIKRPDVQAFEDSVRQIGGREALVRTLEYDKPLHQQPEPARVFALFVNLRLDEDFVQEFSADCPAEVREEFEPVFWAAIESYAFKGGAREAIDRQEEARAAQYARIDALLNRLDNDGDDRNDGRGRASEGRVSPNAAAQRAAIPFEAPADGGDVLTLGGATAQLADKRWGIASHAGSLLATFELTFEDADAARAARLLSSWSGSSTAKIEVSSTGVFSTAGAPLGRAALENGRLQEAGSAPGSRPLGPGPNSARVRLDGFDSGLEFTGTLDLEDGWVSLRGALGVSYDSSQNFPIELTAALPVDALDWAQYVFTDLAEVAAAPPGSVRKVTLAQIDDGADLAPLGRCTALTHVFLRHRSWGEPAPLHIPAELWSAATLESLTIQSIHLPEVPPEVAALDRLERLMLSGCGLNAIDPGILRLPRLVSLDLSRNGLTSLRGAIDLPELKSLDLRDNNLTELPGTLVDCPRLVRLDLRENPWSALPDALGDERFDLELELNEKRRLLGHEYPGSKGVTWDEDAYAAVSSPSLLRAVDDALQSEEELKPHADALRSLVRRGAGLVLGDSEDYALLGNHRVGGMPDLPPTLPYPRFEDPDGDGDSKQTPYEFLCQVDCAALAPMQEHLPRTGFLYFFLSTIHDVYGSGGERAARVLWFDGPREELVSGAHLRFEADEYYEMTAEAYAAFRAEGRSIASPPELYSAHSNPHLFRGPAAALEDDEDTLELAGETAFQALRERFPFDVGFGTAGFTQNEDPEHRAALARGGGPEEWTLLLHLKSCGDFLWGDAGDLFFVAHKSDVARRDFSRVFCTMESS